MFEAKLEDIGLLRDSIATVAELIDETELHIKEYGHFKAVDFEGPLVI